MRGALHLPRWLKRKCRCQDDVVLKPNVLRSNRRDVALTGLVAAAAGLVISTRAASAGSPPPLPGIAGQNFSNVPLSGFSVTDPSVQQAAAALGQTPVPPAIDDGLKGYFATSWTTGQSTLALANYFVPINVTIQNTGPGGLAVMTVPGATTGNFQSPSLDWVGKPIAINGAGVSGGVLVATVIHFYYDSTNSAVETALLSVPAPTPLTASSQTFACPCFMPGDVGKGVFVSNGNAPRSGNANPQRQTQLVDTIATYNSPFSVGITGTFGALSQTTKQGSLVVWGTNNLQAIVNAGLATIAARRTRLYYPGLSQPTSHGLFCAFATEPNAPIAPSAANWLWGQVRGQLYHITADCETFFTSNCDTTYGAAGTGEWEEPMLNKMGIPFNAQPPPEPPRGVEGATHRPGCASATGTLVCVVTGDSWADPNSTGSANDQFTAICRVVQQQNPGRKFIFINRGIGGSTWQWLAGVAVPGQFPPWYLNHSTPWLTYLQTVAAGSLGSVTGDLYVVYNTGGNDGNVLYENDVATVVKTIQSWTSHNGNTPDVLMMCGPKRTNTAQAAGDFMWGQLSFEAASGWLRSWAKMWGIGFIDLETHLNQALHGWTPEGMIMRQVPQLGQMTAGPITPAVIPYLGRDFYLAIALVDATSGAHFWSTAGWLAISLSGKPDNRLWFQPDASGNLNVCAVAWGLPVTTTVTISASSAALATSGQAALTMGAINSEAVAPSYLLGTAGGPYSGLTAMQCLYVPALMFASGAYRSYLSGVTNASNAYTCDSINQVVSGQTGHYGGQMFIPTDATAQVDCIVGGAGSATHMLTGASSLVTKVSGYTNFQSVTLAAVATAGLVAQNVTVFLGSISVQPTYDTAVAAGTDSGATPVLTYRKEGNHVRIGYVLGGANLANIRTVLQTYNEVIVWEGFVACGGAPFLPQIWAGASVNVQLLYAFVGDKRNPCMPVAMERDLFGAGTALSVYETSGDEGHPGFRLLKLIRRCLEAQNFCLGPTPGASGASVVFELKAVGLTANGAIGTLPAGSIITGIYLQETAGATVTGGLNIGTSSGGSQVASAAPVNASSPTSINPGGGGLAEQQVGAVTLFASAVTGWNGASVNAQVLYVLN